MGCYFLAIPGVILSIQRMLVYGPLLALATGFAYYSLTGAREKMAIVLIAATLGRETGALFAAAWFLSLAMDREYRMAAVAAACPLPAAACGSS